MKCLINQKPNKNPIFPIKILFDKKEENIALRMIKSIIDFTKTKIIDDEYTEIKVLILIYIMIQLKNK
jgi:hypothetical protein